jgi:flagellar biosynthesis activator protein FlaF
MTLHKQQATKTQQVIKPSAYKSASKNYLRHSKHVEDTARTIEARALLKSARFLQDIQSRWEHVKSTEIEASLKINRHIWLTFLDHATTQDNKDTTRSLPQNIITLANFVFKRSLDILTKPSADKLTALITINREIAAGLLVVR